MPFTIIYIGFYTLAIYNAFKIAADDNLESRRNEFFSVDDIDRYKNCVEFEDNVTSIRDAISKAPNGEIPVACDEDRAYSSFDSCIRDCERRREGILNSTCYMDYPFTHKVLVLRSNETEVNHDEGIRVLNTTVEKNSYIIYEDGTIRACLPLNNNLSNCIGNFILPNETEFRKYKKLYVPNRRKYFHWSEYFFMDKKIMVCEENDLSTTLDTEASDRETALTCDEDRAYNSADSCMEDCRLRKMGKINSAYEQYHFTHKVVYFSKNEFNITTNNEIRLLKWNRTIKNDSYILFDDGSVRFCSPLATTSCEDFVSFSISDVKKYNNHLRICLKSRDKLFKWNEFFFLNNQLIVCDFQAKEIISKYCDEPSYGITFNRFNEDRVTCKDGRSYMDLDTCIDDCELNKEGVLESPHYMNSPFAYKVLSLKQDEFTITNDSQLSIIKWNRIIKNDSYVLFSDGTVRACLPLIKDLELCSLQETPLTQAQIYENDHKIWLVRLRKYLEWGEFFQIDVSIYNCDDVQYRKMIEIVGILNIIGYSVSICFLCISLLLSLCFKKLRLNIPLQCYSATLILLYIIQFFNAILKEQSPTICIFTSALNQFVGISAFLWINILSFELLIVFKFHNISGRRNKRLFFYCLFGWGTPLPIVFVAVIAEIMEIPLIRPKFKHFCWFPYKSLIAFAYYYGWMALSIVANTIFLILIICLFRKMSCQISSVNKNIQKQLLKVTIKLATIMGFFLIFKVLVWTAFDESIIWFLDVLTSFQGFYVFLVYTFRMHFLRRIWRKICFFTKKKKTNINLQTSQTHDELSSVSNVTASDEV